jgi:hypothetical protein
MIASFASSMREAEGEAIQISLEASDFATILSFLILSSDSDLYAQAHGMLRDIRVITESGILRR